ncbi:MAG: hypothetical protein R3D58_04360 [Saprospiraceae bacterium]|nr:hypothetical protein [Lewinellaceae bacterium]
MIKDSISPWAQKLNLKIGTRQQGGVKVWNLSFFPACPGAGSQVSGTFFAEIEILCFIFGKTVFILPMQ